MRLVISESWCISLRSPVCCFGRLFSAMAFSSCTRCQLVAICHWRLTCKQSCWRLLSRVIAFIWHLSLSCLSSFVSHFILRLVSNCSRETCYVRFNFVFCTCCHYSTMWLFPVCNLCFLPRDAHSAKRGIAIVSRPSVCLSVRPSVTLMYPEHISWTSSKLVTLVSSLRSSLLGATTSAI